jgi:hypothetical protein
MGTDCRCVFCADDCVDDIFQGSIFGRKGACERGKSIPAENIT